MIRASNNPQMGTHSRSGALRFGRYALAPADYSQDRPAACRARFTEFQSGFCLCLTYPSQVTGRGFGSGPFGRLPNCPTVPAAARRLDHIPFHSRRSSLFPRMHPVDRILLPGRPGAVFISAGALNSCRRQFLATARHLCQDRVEPSHHRLPFLVNARLCPEQYGRSIREWRYLKPIIRCPK